MTYDRLAESLRLIGGGAVAGADRLTRRRRFLPVAVDVDDDIAVTVFLRRAHGGAEWETHVLSRAGADWRLLGGGGWGPDSLDVLTHAMTSTELGGVAQADGAGAVSTGAGWIRYSMIRTTSDVEGVLVGSRRALRPEHGHMAVVWRDRLRLPVTVVGRGGRTLQDLELRA